MTPSCTCVDMHSFQRPHHKRKHKRGGGIQDGHRHTGRDLSSHLSKLVIDSAIPVLSLAGRSPPCKIPGYLRSSVEEVSRSARPVSRLQGRSRGVASASAATEEGVALQADAAAGAALKMLGPNSAA